MDETTRARLETRVARLEQQIRAFKELHASELGLILDELAGLRAELASLARPAPAAAPVDPNDPAANSPKRAKWLEDERRKEERRSEPLTRREMLRGREPDPKG